jgi:O-antigen ligase
MLTPLQKQPEDAMFQSLILIALLLEVVVFMEPAPVDALIILCIGTGLGLGKLTFSSLSALPAVSLVVYVLANLLSMYDPIDVRVGVIFVLETLYLVATWFFFVGVSARYGRQFVARMINAYCVAGVFSALLGAAAYYNLIPFTHQLLMGGRVRGLFKDCNVYGPYFVPIPLFALTSILTPYLKWSRKTGSIIAIALAVLAMLLSFSRGCWINFVVSLCIFIIGQVSFRRTNNVMPRREWWGRMRILATFAVVCMIAVAYVCLYTPAVSHMLSVRVTSNGLQDYDRVRFATQAVALETAKEHPLGLGPGQVELAFNYSTHSMFIRILTENGVIGLLAFLVFLAATIRRAWTVIWSDEDLWLREVNLVALACIAGHLVNSFVIDTDHWRHIWFIYALPWTPARLNARHLWVPGRIRASSIMHRQVAHKCTGTRARATQAAPGRRFTHSSR